MITTTFKTLIKKKLADTVSPVSLYLKLRDLYPNTLLLESSDYHSKEDSFSFLCIDPLRTLLVKNHKAYWKTPQKTLEQHCLKETALFDLKNTRGLSN